MKEYGKCPVCENIIMRGERCRTCGYIESTDYSLYKTLEPIEKQLSTVGKNKKWKKQTDDAKERQHQKELAELQKRIEEMERERQLEKQRQEEEKKKTEEKRVEQERIRQEAERREKDEREKARREAERKEKEKRKAEEEQKRIIEETEAKRKAEKRKRTGRKMVAAAAICAVVVVCVVVGLFMKLSKTEDNKISVASAVVEAQNSQTSEATTSSEDDISTVSEAAVKQSSQVADASTNENVNEDADADVKVGDTIRFGKYEQNGDGEEDIEWIVLDKQDGKLLVVSKYILDSQAYNDSSSKLTSMKNQGFVQTELNFKTSSNISFDLTTWENCSIREWLNEDFLNAAFSSEEQSQIVETEDLNSDNPDYDTDGGNDVSDKVFLLSVEEAENEEYFASDDARECEATEYAKNRGVSVDDHSGNSWWWLRSGGVSGDFAANVTIIGEVHSRGINVDRDGIGVRPALWINPDSCSDNNNPGTTKKTAKPVIYLYPEKKTNVTVSLDIDGKFTTVYPSFDNNTTWTVSAEPDGILRDKSGQTYNYLYWEAEDNTKYDFQKGFCIKGTDTRRFLEDKLKALGLTRKEANEFIVYWLPKMEGNNYNIISFQTNAYTEANKLVTFPAADTTIRVFMAWYASNTQIEIPEQSIDTPKREGFTVVEWGGTEIK